MFFSTLVASRPAMWRVLSAAALSAALLSVGVSSTSAAPASQPAESGTIVGSVSCGASDPSPAAQAVVEVAGADVSTRAAGDGKFILDNVPVGQVVTVTALSDPLGSDATSRPDVSLQPGETLDIGNLDLSACPAPVATAAADDQPPDGFQDQP